MMVEHVSHLANADGDEVIIRADLALSQEQILHLVNSANALAGRFANRADHSPSLHSRGSTSAVRSKCLYLPVEPQAIP